MSKFVLQLYNSEYWPFLSVFTVIVDEGNSGKDDVDDGCSLGENSWNPCCWWPDCTREVEGVVSTVGLMEVVVGVDLMNNGSPTGWCGDPSWNITLDAPLMAVDCADDGIACGGSAACCGCWPITPGEPSCRDGDRLCECSKKLIFIESLRKYEFN